MAGKKNGKKKNSLNIIGTAIIVGGICVLVYWVHELALLVPNYSPFFTIWAIGFVILFPILIPWYFWNFKHVLITCEQGVSYGIFFTVFLIWILCAGISLLYKSRNKTMMSIVLFLIIGIVSASVLAWVFSNAYLFIQNRINKRKNNGESKKYINCHIYKCITDYISGGLTVLSLILLFSSPTNKQTADVSIFGSYFGGIMCAYDLLLMVIEDVYGYFHKKNQKQSGD